MSTTPYKLDFSKAILVTIDSNATSNVYTVPADCIWKIESAGVGGTNGAIYLLQDHGTPPPAPEKIAILGTTIGDDDYACKLPFWLESGFTARFQNESGYKGSVSITEYVISSLA